LRTGAERRINHFVKPNYFEPGRSQRENACGLLSSVTRGRFSVTKDFDMKAFFAACIAVGVLWAVDVEMNGGRYGDVVKKAVVSILPK
jgi:hypothetical protein